MEEHYIELLRKAIGKELGKEARLEYSIIMEQPAAGASPLHGEGADLAPRCGAEPLGADADGCLWRRPSRTRLSFRG